MKIKLTRPLWGKKKDDVINVDEMRRNFAVRKGYAVEVTERKTKLEPGVNTRKDK